MVKTILILNPSESGILRATIYKKQMKMQDVASELGCNRSSFTLMVQGKRRMTSDIANKLYNLLDQDSTLSFLYLSKSSLENTAQNTKNLSESWDKLYDHYSGGLKQLFLSTSTEEKCQILSDLEIIIGKYQR